MTKISHVSTANIASKFSSVTVIVFLLSKKEWISLKGGTTLAREATLSKMF